MSDRSTLRLVFRQNAPNSTGENAPLERPRNLMDEIQIIRFLDPVGYEVIDGWVKDKVASLAANTARRHRIALATLFVLGPLGA